MAVKSDLKVSIIVCFYERVAYLKCCLDSLVPSSKLFDEVVIADDGSDAVTVGHVTEIISRYPFPVKHVRQPKAGFRAAAARNNGVRHAIGDYLIFLDCDFIVLPDTLALHLANIRKKRFLSGYCKYLSRETSEKIISEGVDSADLQQIYHDLSEDNLARDHRKFIARTWRIRFGLASPRKQTLGGHFSIFRDDFEAVNGYDEKFVGWGGEDIDLGIRLAASGIYGRSVIQSARVLHLWHPREPKSERWEEGVNQPYFARNKIKPFCDYGLVRRGDPCS